MNHHLTDTFWVLVVAVVLALACVVGLTGMVLFAALSLAVSIVCVPVLVALAAGVLCLKLWGWLRGLWRRPRDYGVTAAACHKGQRLYRLRSGLLTTEKAAGPIVGRAVEAGQVGDVVRFEVRK